MIHFIIQIPLMFPDLIANIFMPIKDLVSDLFLCTFKMISLLSSFLKNIEFFSCSEPVHVKKRKHESIDKYEKIPRTLQIAPGEGTDSLTSYQR